MRNANSPNEPTELTDVLKEWQASDTSSALDQRILASYRQQVNRVPFWRRFFTTSIPVPLPLVIIQAMLFLIASGAVIAFFQERDRRTLPVATNQRATEVLPVTVRQESPTARASVKKRMRSRSAKTHTSAIKLPPSGAVRPILATANEPVSATLSSEIQTAALAIAPESSLPTAGPEHKLVFIPALHFKAKLPDPLKFDFAQTNANEFVFDAPLEKDGEGRISRTITRAGNWVAKPLEKGIELYRLVPRTIPTINSFIAPAKDACLAPFRSAPVNVQVN